MGVVAFPPAELVQNHKECLFAQTGDKSHLSRNLDSLCITVGNLLKRQSDRSLPRTMFEGGVREGHMQAHHMTGIMIVLAVGTKDFDVLQFLYRVS